MKTKVAIVDDHVLMAKALSKLVQSYDNYEVVYEVHNGVQLQERISLNMVPEIILLDVSMPIMDGYQTSLWLRNNHPKILTLALSMNDKDEAIIKMLRNGVKGYLLKDCKPNELKNALDALISKGFYYTEFVTSQLIKSLNQETHMDPVTKLGLNEREIQFIKLSCSDKTYTEIADVMCVSPRTVDGYRESVFQKMNVKTRVAMVMQAIHLKIVELPS